MLDRYKDKEVEDEYSDESKNHIMIGVKGWGEGFDDSDFLMRHWDNFTDVFGRRNHGCPRLFVMQHDQLAAGLRIGLTTPCTVHYQLDGRAQVSHGKLSFYLAWLILYTARFPGYRPRYTREIFVIYNEFAHSIEGAYF